MHTEVEIGDESHSRLGLVALIAVVVSLLLHGLVVFWAMRHQMSNFGEAYYEQIVPRKFKLERVEIDPALLDQPDEPVKPRMDSRPVPLEMPTETIEMETPVRATAMESKPREVDIRELETTTPPPTTSLADAVKSVEATSASVLTRELDSLRDQLVEADPTSANRPVIDLPPVDVGGEAAVLAMRAASMPGYSSLDALLSQTGPLQSNPEPILMPSGLLFDYDMYELKEAARSSLLKLGALIERNPEATFTIEGHTDTFGGDGYNLDLSERRALAVKAWLVSILGADPNRIRTIGFGSTKTIVDPNGSIEEQTLNRRVEIVIDLPEGPVPAATLP